MKNLLHWLNSRTKERCLSEEHLLRVGLSILLFAISIGASAQSKKSDSIFLEAARLPIENVYLHLDKYACLPGDTIWFKAYLFKNNYPANISSNLYVELCNTEGQLISRRVFHIDSGASSGQIFVPDSVKHDCWIRSYTRYQTNFDSTQYFMVPLGILQPGQKDIATKKRLTNEQPVAIFNNELLLVSSYRDSGIDCQLILDSSSRLINKQLQLIVASFHQPVYRANFKVGEKLSREVFIPKEGLSGPVDLLLADHNDLIARETIFIPESKSLDSVDLVYDDIHDEAFADNAMHLELKDSTIYNVSISVTDADVTSPIPVPIVASESPDPLDYNLAWKGRLPTIRFIDTSGIELAGTIHGLSGKPVGAKELAVFISKDTSILQAPHLVKIDSAGHFLIANNYFFDSAKVNFQLNDLILGQGEAKDCKRIKMVLDSSSYAPPIQAEAIRKWVNTIYYSSATNIEKYAQMGTTKNAKVLPTVTVKRWLSPRLELDKKYATGIFSEPTAYSFDVRTEKRYRNIWDYLRYALPGFVGGFVDSPRFNNHPVLFYVDGQITFFKNVEDIWFEDLAYIKVFPRFWVDNSAYTQFVASGGIFRNVASTSAGLSAGTANESPAVICLYTRKGRDYRTAYDDLPHFPIIGFTRPIIFNQHANNGSTLYWQPSANISSKNEFPIHFQNNSITKRFRVVIEGVAQNGARLHYEKIVDPAEIKRGMAALGK